ncbi:MAG: hypothetical protein HC798_04345 [Polaribacter sp.]|nr:hypothetical protein [Polaribacter sp.]
MPNLQEYFAVKYLKDHQIINDDAIFISGYAGDILGGSEYKNYPKKVEKENLADIIFDTKFLNTNFSDVDKKQVVEHVNQIINNYNPTLSDKILETVLDDFNLKERIAKYIFNSASFYSFFGYQYIFPFWDKELVAFFKNLNPDLKKNKSFYDELLINEFFKEFDVNFSNDFIYQKQKRNFKSLKKIIKPFLPNFIKQNQLDQRDWNHYKLITKPMLKELERNKIKVSRLYKDYNEIISQWYLFKIKSSK